MRAFLAPSFLGLLLVGLVLVLHEGCTHRPGDDRRNHRPSGDAFLDRSPGQKEQEQGNDWVKRELTAARAQEIEKLRDEVSALTLALEISRSAATGDSFEARKARADALFEAESWMQAGDGYVELLRVHTDRPEAEAILEKALEAYEWEDSEKQIDVLNELLQKFPSRRTAPNVFNLAVLRGVHGDARAALDEAGDALQHLPVDTFRLHALRMIAGLCRKTGAVRDEERFLREAHSLAALLGDESAATAIQKSLKFLADRD